MLTILRTFTILLLFLSQISLSIDLITTENIEIIAVKIVICLLILRKKHWHYISHML